MGGNISKMSSMNHDLIRFQSRQQLCPSSHERQIRRLPSLHFPVMRHSSTFLIDSNIAVYSYSNQKDSIAVLRFTSSRSRGVRRRISALDGSKEDCLLQTMLTNSQHVYIHGLRPVFCLASKHLQHASSNTTLRITPRLLPLFLLHLSSAPSPSCSLSTLLEA